MNVAALFTLPTTDLIAGLALGAGLAVVLTRAVIVSGPVDTPRDRGAHDNPTPTSGGMAVIAATALAVAIILIQSAGLIGTAIKPALALFVFAALMGVSGAVDDLMGLPARLRFGFQTLCAFGLAALFPVTELNFGFGVDVSLWWPVGVAGTALWLITVVNAVNFMDGANGLAPGSQSAALIALALLMGVFGPDYPIAGTAALLLLILCALGANLGFAPFNVLGGRVFQGDAGALFSAALIGGAVPIVHSLGYGSIWFGGYILAPLLVDVILTLILRWRSKERLFEAHKRHLYQQYIHLTGASHTKVSAIVLGLCLVCGAFGLITEYIYASRGVDLRFVELVVLVAVLSLGWLRLRRRIGAH